MRCLQLNKFWYPRAGADIYAMDLASALQRHGHRIRVLATAHPANHKHEDDRFWPVYHELSRGGRGLGWLHKIQAAGAALYNRAAVRALNSLIAHEPVDVAHAHNFVRHLSPAPLAALRRKGVAVVATLHDHWPTCPSYSLVHGNGDRCEWECVSRGVMSCVRHNCVAGSGMASAFAVLEAGVHRMMKWGLELVDAVICPSRFMAESLERLGARRNVHVVPHPRPRYPWVPPPATTPRILYAGRLAREKGVHILMAAARQAGWELVIAGQGPYEAALRQEAASLPNVRFVGFLSRPDVIEMMRQCHVIAVPSNWYENAPLVVIEAAAVGRPVVASDIGGIPEYIASREWSRLVPPGDAPALRTAIDDLVRHDGTATLARCAWEDSAAAPGWEEHVQAVETVYRAAMQR